MPVIRRAEIRFGEVMKALIPIFIVLLALASCTSTRYVPVTNTQRDSVYITKERTDTFIQRDSIVQLIKGDTIREVRYKYIERYRNRIDTIYKERTDTITQVVKVERPLKLREKVMMNIGGFALVILVILIGFGILKFTRKL